MLSVNLVIKLGVQLKVCKKQQHLVGDISNDIKAGYFWEALWI